jgi:enoyl-CoA hydratase/carnithine racemase
MPCTGQAKATFGSSSSAQRDLTSVSEARCENGPATTPTGFAFVADVNQSYRAIEALRVPTLAAVQGVAMGGGFELALACDLIVAAENAVFRNVEVTTAMLPIAGGMQRLADHIGRARAARMAIFGDSISATDAFRMGLVSHLVPTLVFEGR